ncbi:hypothetical protein EDC32_10871 [Laceyella sacchari]|jgi:hypothetical protein|uniref:hypothetical protein n=1 Tax=Laceyella sacchari TaxID=37482 RepID=UPI000B102682|nr:hypothetical protein [Laceyella sacchari]TCW35359.1 hypothetical protein EDC32_10871 [Laceyella sacchari]
MVECKKYEPTMNNFEALVRFGAETNEFCLYCIEEDGKKSLVLDYPSPLFADDESVRIVWKATIKECLEHLVQGEYPEEVCGS